ncbi:hypothetical protein M231_04552 [Tremella mesenterica]|uniref:Golgi apyrase n=1 Tax=Tremella mesenterica TaxID=5217 RepID=A0A4Q1BK85_TREME|nr:hypothetical protein M231_04552 [Tremella mesenterica]
MAPSITPLSTQYALVIDAGSSGSRLQIYSWRDPDLERAEILKEVQEARKGRGGRKWWWKDAWGKGKGKGKGEGEEKVWTEKEMERRALRRLVRVGKGVEGDGWVKRVEPGISSISPEDIPSYLAPLITHALEQIPPSQHHRTPIYLYATAGMRLLSDDTRSAILTSACDTIRSSSPFSISGPSSAGPCGENIRVISGEEEGLWGWVAVNYLMDGFGHAPPYPSSSSSTLSSSSTTTAEGSTITGLLPLAPLAEPPPDSSEQYVTPVDINHHSPTFGFLDMGGASTQLAFSPTSSEVFNSGFPKEQLRTVSLKLLSGEQVEWSVFVASWLGFGTNKVRERYLNFLIENWKSSNDILDLSIPIQDPCLPSNLYIPSSEPNNHPGFLGIGSFENCLKDLKPLLDHHVPCPTNHCLFAGLPTPHIDFEREDQRGFIGISEYWYTAQQVLGLGGIWDWGEWERGMNEFCSKDWNHIERQVEQEKGWLGSQVELSRLQTQCFKGAWVSNVLHEGIGIPRLVDAKGTDTITGGSIGDTALEAARRAREKGLASKKSHFQSMDEVDSTTISWTLGKMIIEASQSIQPTSHWYSSPSLPFDLSIVSDKIDQMGYWSYPFFLLFLLFGVLGFSIFKRRFKRCIPNTRRVRKSSISTSYEPLQTSNWSSFKNSFWSLSSLSFKNPLWPLSTISKDSIYAKEPISYLEDTSESLSLSSLSSLSKRNSKYRWWMIKSTNFIRRILPLNFNNNHNNTRNSHFDHRQQSILPLRRTSLPINTNSKFIPTPTPIQSFSNKSSSSPTTTTTPSVSPPRTRSWPSKSRTKGLSTISTNTGGGIGGLSTNTSFTNISTFQNTSLNSNSNPITPSAITREGLNRSGKGVGVGVGVGVGIGNGLMNGWNDPPLSMFDPHTPPPREWEKCKESEWDITDEENLETLGTLTPNAAPVFGSSTGLAAITNYDNHSALSRNSSRMNLGELAGVGVLAQRNASRSTTPLEFESA